MLVIVWLLFARLAENQSSTSRNCSTRQHSKEYVCGVAGVAGGEEEPQGRPFYSTSFQVCRDIALATYDPTFDVSSSFSFDTGTNSCTLFGRTGFYDLIKDKESTTYFYVPQCFRCARLDCPIPTGQNLLINSGFEATNEIGAPWLQQLTTRGHNSSQAAISPVDMYQIVPLCANATYKLSLSYKYIGKPAKPKSGFYLQYFLDHSSQSFNYLKVWDTKDIWIRLEDYVQLPKMHIRRDDYPVLSISSVFLGDESIKLLLDDVQLFGVDPRAALTPKPGSKSVITNGGFESGSLAPWKFDIFPTTGSQKNGTARVVSPGINSDHSLQLRNPGGSRVYFEFFQSMSTQPLTQYVFCFDYILQLRGQDQRGSTTLSINIGTKSFGHERYNEALVNYRLIRNGPHTMKIPVLADAELLTVYFDLLSENGEDVVFDNIKLIEANF